MPNGAAGGTPLAELPSQRQWCGGRRAGLWLCPHGGVPPSSRDTRDAALSSALLFRYCLGTAGQLLCSAKHPSLRYLHFSEESVPATQQAEANLQPALLRSACRLGAASCQGKRRTRATLLLRQSLNPAFPWEPTLAGQQSICWRGYS